MILLRDYNEEKHLDRAWYDSSCIVYSECDDNVDALKTLRVTFKNGSTYQYNNVDVNDYLLFMRGGLDGSNGKALNKYIKTKCEFERIGDLDTQVLKEEMLRLKDERQKTKEEKPE